MLDLQVIRPNPVVEYGGKDLCEVEGSELFATAEPAAAEVDAMVAAGLLVEEARDDHDVRKHYGSGAELVADFEDSSRDLPAEWIPRLSRSSRRARCGSAAACADSERWPRGHDTALKRRGPGRIGRAATPFAV